MKVFDLGKSLSHLTASHLVCTDDFAEEIKAFAEAVKGPPEPIPDICIQVVEDALERKARAIHLAFSLGRSTLFEDEKGHICEVSMPTPPFSPFCALKFNASEDR